MSPWATASGARREDGSEQGKANALEEFLEEGRVFDERLDSFAHDNITLPRADLHSSRDEVQGLRGTKWAV